VLESDKSLVSASDYILSIVPPRDALNTATRISSAFNTQPAKTTPLYYFDLNGKFRNSSYSLSLDASSDTWARITSNSPIDECGVEDSLANRTCSYISAQRKRNWETFC
jgi:hypothetical protein